MKSTFPENRLLSEGLVPKASREPAKPNWVGRLVIFAALSIGSIAGCIVLLRNTVHMVSAPASKVQPVQATKLSRGVESDEDFHARKRRNELFLAEAMQEDAAFIRDRQRKTQVERWEAKVAESAKQRVYYDEEGKVIPESILWHQQQRLEKLREDSPNSY